MAKSSSVLTTREGAVVSELGSWEREQLSKLRKTAIDKVPDNIKTKSKLKDPALHHLYRPSLGCKNPYRWTVKIAKDGQHICSKNFADKDYGTPEKALEAAIAHRDLVLKNHGIKV